MISIRCKNLQEKLILTNSFPISLTYELNIVLDDKAEYLILQNNMEIKIAVFTTH